MIVKHRPTTDHQSHIQRRFKLSIVLSVASKLSACILQFVSIPIAVKYLGLDGYAFFAVLMAISMGPLVLVLRFGPVLTGPLAAERATSQWEALAARFWAACVASMASVVAAGAIALLLYYAGVVQIPSVAVDLAPESALKTLAYLALVNLLSTALIIFEDTQAAFHESHMQGLRVTIGNVLALVTVVSVFPRYPDALGYAIALTLPPFVVRFANVITFLYRHPEIRGWKWALDVQSVWRAGKQGFAFTAVVGVGAYASNQLPILAAAAFLDAPSTASVSVIQQLTLVMFAFGSVFVIGFLPAFQSSLVVGNVRWVVDWLHRIELIFAAIGMVGIIGFVVLGPFIHNGLLKSEMVFGVEAMLFAGYYGFCLIVEHFFFILASGIGLASKVGRLFLIRAVLTALAAFGCCYVNYPSGIWLCGAVLASVLTIRTYRKSIWTHVGNTQHLALAALGEDMVGVSGLRPCEPSV